jgi:acetyl-CoA acetyltransferase
MRVKPSSYDGVALIAPVTVPYAKVSEHGAPWFIGSALGRMVKTLGINKSEVDGLAVSSFTLAPDSVITLTEHFDLEPSWIEQIPLGGASGVVAMRRAARAIQAGDAQMIACIGGDTATQGSFAELVGNFSNFTRDAAYPYGAAGPNAAFSLITQYYMDTFAATREDFGRIAVSQRYNANHNSDALFHQKKLNMQDYLNAPSIAGPVHLFDCVMPCAGADGFMVTSVERAKNLQVPYAVILGSGERHNSFSDDPVQFRGGWSKYCGAMYDSAGLGPADMNFLQTYDDYPVISMLQMEGLGFCAQGEASQFVRQTDFNFDGSGLPHNTSGGQLSVGQAGSAGGYLGLVEAIRQLTGVANENAIADAQVGMVSGYGMVNYDRGLCSAAAIVAKGNAAKGNVTRGMLHGGSL